MENIAKTYKFDRGLINTHLASRHPVHKGKDSYWVRLVEGESLKEKEQSEFAKPYRFFVDGEFMTVENYNEQEFLESRKDFGVRIVEFDKQAEYKKDRDSFNALVDLWVNIRQLEETDKRGLGYRLFGKSALSMDVNELQLDINSYANSNPEKVAEMLSEANDTDYAIIGLAMAMEVIEEAEAGSKVRFVETGELVTSVARGQVPIDAVAELFKTNEGRELKRRIYQLLQPQVADEVVEKAASKRATNTAK